MGAVYDNVFAHQMKASESTSNDQAVQVMFTFALNIKLMKVITLTYYIPVLLNLDYAIHTKNAMSTYCPSGRVSKPGASRDRSIIS